jgi:hypothetical protein
VEQSALEIQMVRENVALAVALWVGVRKGRITRDHFPIGRAAVTTDDGHLVAISNVLELRSERDLQRCVANHVRVAVGFSAIHTNRTLQNAYLTPPVEEADPELRGARCMFHLLNEAFSQNMLTPTWACPPAYRQRFEVPPASIGLDATGLDGNPVYWSDFGGLEPYVQLLSYCADQVAQASTLPAATPQAAVQETIQPSAPWAKHRGASLGEGSVAEFVAGHCVESPTALATASDLYRSYVAWCDISETIPVVQRSFGMRLTELGFQRRRRGRGRHWWQGIAPLGTQGARSPTVTETSRSTFL